MSIPLVKTNPELARNLSKESKIVTPQKTIVKPKEVDEGKIP
jgi:hypothetical protein